MVVVVGLSRPVVDRLIKSVPERPVGFQRDNLVSETIGTAFYNLGFNRAKADNIGSYLIKQNPSIDGTIYDETPNRKTRTELTARATSFSTNQRFYGGNTSTGKTALSVFAWVRPTTLSGSKTIIGESVELGNDRGWLIYFDGSNLRVIVSADGDTTNAKNYVTTASFTVSEWIHVGFVFGSGALTLYVDGKAAAVTQTTNGTVATINDSAQSIELASTNGGANYLTGQLQQPLIYEGVWSAAQIRDLYLQQYDDIPITYGWFLNGDTASGLTSSSPALTPSNAPDIYEDDAVPVDWLNEKGWNGAAEFNGTSSWIELETQPIDTTGDFKLSMYAKPATGGAENFIGYDTIQGNCLSYFNAASSSIILRINNNLRTFTFPQTSAEIREGGDLIIERVSGTTTIIYQGVTSPETLVESGLFHIETVGRERSNYFEGIIRNFVYEESGVVLVNLPLDSDAIDISGNGNDGTDTDVTYVPIPKRWDEELDSAGDAAHDSNSFGTAKRDGQLADGNCISLDGVNQYGVITNTDDFSGEDWTLSGYVIFNELSADDRIFVQAGGGGHIWIWPRPSAWQSYLDTSTKNYVGVSPPTEGKVYFVSLNKSGTSFVLTVVNETDGVTEISDPLTITMESRSGNLIVGSKDDGLANFIDGKIWGWKLDHANGFELPMAEGSGTISYDVSGNGKDCTWQNSPSWSTQDSYFWSEAVGYSLYEHASSADLLVPLKSDGTALTITPPTGYTKTADYIAGSYHNNSQALLEEFPVTDSGSQRAVGYGASFDGATSKIQLPILLSIDRDAEIRFKFKADAWTSNQTLFCCNNGSNNRIAIVSHGGNIRVFFYNGTIALKASENATTGEEHEIYVKYKASTYELISATLDGVEMSGVSAASVNSAAGSFLGINSTGTVWGSVGFYEGYIRNLSLHDNGVKVLDLPLYKDSLDRSPNCNHGTDTAITYLTEARATNLNPTISETNTRAVTTGDRKIIRIGQQ